MNFIVAWKRIKAFHVEINFESNKKKYSHVDAAFFFKNNVVFVNWPIYSFTQILNYYTIFMDETSYIPEHYHYYYYLGNNHAF